MRIISELALALLIASAVLAAAQTIDPQIGGGIGFSFDGGIAGKKAASSPPSSCAGALDLSAGCPLPMLGVL